MNLPNKLTVLRVLLIPFFVVLLLIQDGENNMFRMIATGIFVIASFTDYLDGYLARRDGLVTNFGKFMDPLADKLLVCSALICLVELKQIPSWMVIVIVSREFIISGFRLIAVEQGVVIAAGYWGKLKTVSQMVSIILLILNIPQLELITNLILWIAVILTIVSLLDYIIKNKNVLTEGVK